MEDKHIVISSSDDSQLKICLIKPKSNITLCENILYEEQEDFLKFDKFAILNNKAFQSYMKKTYNEETYQKLQKARNTLHEVYEMLTTLKKIL